MRQERVEAKSNPPSLRKSPALRGFEEYLNPGLTILFGLGAALFFILAVIGTVRNYSPVPFWDMWDDYIGFYLKIHAGAWGAWWAQHNEHRIILARLFFWIDIACFHGNGIFSFIVIYVSALAVGFILAKIWKEQSRGRDLYILFFVEAWIFSWSQQENLTWAFQSQFILAQLLPLAALYFLHLSCARADRAKFYFWIATVCGVLAIGTMANGVLALPAMALYTIIAARSFRQAAFFTVLAAVEIHFYFKGLIGSHFPGAAPTFAGEVLQHPGGFIQFFLMYLGGPFIFLFGKADFLPEATLLGAFLAAALVLLCAGAFYVNLRKTERPSLPLALLVFIFYIMATAAITAAGRLPLGLHAALASRYSTPALYGWAAALLLFWPTIARSIRFRNIFVLILAAFLCFVMLPRQLRALTGQQVMLYQTELAALPLELQIDDFERIQLLYPWPAVVLQIAKGARAQHLSIFGFLPLGGAHLLFGQKIQAGISGQCRGNVDAITTMAYAPNYVRVRGWLYNNRRIITSELVFLVDQSNEIVGLGLVGGERPDVAYVLGHKALYSGFNAYLSAKAKGQRISVFSPSNGCKLPSVIARFNQGGMR